MLPNAPPAAIFAPFLEVVENTLPPVFYPEELPHREFPPLAACFQPVQDRFNYLANINFCVIHRIPKF
jgi:hypothetical protein